MERPGRRPTSTASTRHETPRIFDGSPAGCTELDARLRVGGMTDEESKALGVVIDDVMLGRAQQTTWRTDAGDLDV